MNRALLPIMIVVCVVIAASLAWLTLSRREAPRPEPRIVRNAALPPFHRIEVEGIAIVTLVQDGSEGVDFDVPGNARGIRAEVRDGTLRIFAPESARWWTSLFGHGTPRSEARVVVRYKAIDHLDLSGAVRVSARAMRAGDLAIDASGGSSLRIEALDAKRLEVSGSGALDARLAGEVESERVSISGAGSYHAEQLRARQVKVEVSGVGKVVVRAEDTLDASISGAGTIDYYGDPKVTQAVSGVGSVRHRASGKSEDASRGGDTARNLDGRRWAPQLSAQGLA